MGHYDTRFWTARKLARCRKSLRGIVTDQSREGLHKWATEELAEIEAVLTSRKSIEAYDVAVVRRRLHGLPLHGLTAP